MTTLTTKTKLTSTSGTFSGLMLMHDATRTFEKGTQFELLSDFLDTWTLRFEDGTEWNCHKNRLS